MVFGVPILKHFRVFHIGHLWVENFKIPDGTCIALTNVANQSCPDIFTFIIVIIK